MIISSNNTNSNLFQYTFNHKVSYLQADENLVKKVAHNIGFKKTSKHISTVIRYLLYYLADTQQIKCKYDKYSL